jgi:branched-chain amino acid transport system substrate-binding protein
MTKKLFVVGVVVILAFVFIAGVFIYTQPIKPEGVNVGAILPLTGNFAVYGENIKFGIDLAVEDINNQSGILGKNLVVRYEDDQGDPKTTVTAFQKLVTVDKVPVIIGGAISSTVKPTASIADKYQIVLFSPSASSPALTGISKYFFRNFPSDVVDGKIMAEFASDKLKLQNISILYANDEWGVGISGVFEKTFKDKGGTIVAKEAFEPGATDFRTQLTKIKGSNPQAIYVLGYQKELLIILKQKEELGIKTQILGSYGFNDPQILQQTGPSAEGVIFTNPTFNSDSQDITIKNFVTKYKAKYGREPDFWAAQDTMQQISLHPQ